MSILTSQEIADITSDIHEIVTDVELSTRITYRLAGVTAETSYDPTTQAIPSMFSTSSVSAFKGTYSLDEAAQSGGLIEYGDVKFIVMRSHVTGILGTIDQVFESGSSVQSGTTYQVVGSLSYDPLKICYFIHCRAV